MRLHSFVVFALLATEVLLFFVDGEGWSCTLLLRIGPWPLLVPGMVLLIALHDLVKSGINLRLHILGLGLAWVLLWLEVGKLLSIRPGGALPIGVRFRIWPLRIRIQLIKGDLGRGGNPLGIRNCMWSLHMDILQKQALLIVVLLVICQIHILSALIIFLFF
jgi:hypothetical protein